VTFDQPLWLLALLLLPAFWWVARFRSLVDLTPERRNLTLALRAALVSALVFALAGLNLVTTNPTNCTLFVIDASYSMPKNDRQRALEMVNDATRHMRGRDRIGVVTVGAGARLAFEPSERGKVACDLTVPDGSQTDLARGIAAALSYFPDDAARRIVLVTDGNETVGSALEAARSAASEEVPVDVIPLGRPPDKETLLDRMLTPPAAKRGEPFPVKVVATSVAGGPGVIKLYRNGRYVGEQKVELKPGKNALQLNDKADAPGFYTYEARLQMAAGRDTVEENNRAVSFVKVQGEPRILLVRPGKGEDVVPDAFLPRALAAQNVRVDDAEPKDVPTNPTALLNYDGVILSDVPAESLTDTQQRVLQAAVRDLGIGLTMIGGPGSFGAGGYFRTPIEEALPVEMDVRKMRRFPGVALALSIDYSGSMNSAGQHTSSNLSKLDLAREAADRAVDALGPQDQVGILAVDTQANVVVPLRYATDKADIHAGIAAINGGSGTEMSAAVRASYNMLEKADARVKHAILVTDGETGPYNYSDLIAAMKEKKITFSLVVIDEGQKAAGIDPLRAVVKATGGRYYRVRDPSEIPKIYTREVLTVSKPPLLEEPFLPRVSAEGSPLLSGIDWGSVPPLLGYDVVVSKPTAEVSLVSHKGDAVLATWQYGLGKSVAFTSDAKARWGAQWVNWSAYGPFWAQALRWSLKKSESGSYQSSVELANGKGRITVDAVDEKTGAYVNFLDARASVLGPGGTSQTVRLTQTGSGRYVGEFDAAKTGSYVATVTQKGQDGKTRATSVGLAVPYSPEYAALAPNTALLTRVAETTGGRVLDGGEKVFLDRRVRRQPVPLALPLLALALFLFPLDVAARRLMLSPRQTREIAEAARERVVAQAAARRAARAVESQSAAASSVARLRARKAALEEEEADSLAADTPIAPPPARPAAGGNGVTWGGNAPPPTSARGPNPAPPTDAAGADRLARLREAKKRAAAQDDE
jgi:Mg-chelatase subunit ChlD